MRARISVDGFSASEVDVCVPTLPQHKQTQRTQGRSARDVILQLCLYKRVPQCTIPHKGEQERLPHSWIPCWSSSSALFFKVKIVVTKPQRP